MPDRSSDHLSPETFVDLLDGIPVDARHHQHLRACRECRDELDDIRSALAGLKAAPADDAGAVATRRRRGHFVAIAAAAAAVVAALVLIPPSRPTSSGSIRAENEAILPPIDEDEDYRLLLALSRDAEDSEIVLDAIFLSAPFSPDPSELTPTEQRNLAEEIARALRSSS